MVTITLRAGAAASRRHLQYFEQNTWFSDIVAENSHGREKIPKVLRFLQSFVNNDGWTNLYNIDLVKKDRKLVRYSWEEFDILQDWQKVSNNLKCGLPRCVVAAQKCLVHLVGGGGGGGGSSLYMIRVTCCCFVSCEEQQMDMKNLIFVHTLFSVLTK